VKRAMTQVNVEIVKRSDCAKGFVVLPKRWLVERTFAWCSATIWMGKRIASPRNAPEANRLPQPECSRPVYPFHRFNADPLWINGPPERLSASGSGGLFIHSYGTLHRL
jgi:transposase